MDGVGLLLIGASPYPVLFNPLQGSFLQYLLHLLVIAVHAKECGAEDKELGREHLHQDIADKGAERDVVEALSLLTHKKNQPYSEYLDRIIDSDNPIAIAVKKNDLLDNLARNDKATEAKQRIFEKHSRAIERLRAEVRTKN